MGRKEGVGQRTSDELGGWGRNELVFCELVLPPRAGATSVGQDKPAAAPHQDWADRSLDQPLQGALPGGSQGETPGQQGSGL